MHTWGLQYIYASLHPIFHPYAHAVLSIKQYRMPFFHSVVVYTGAELALEHIHCFSASVTIPLFSESRIPLIYLLNNYTTHCFISITVPSLSDTQLQVHKALLQLIIIVTIFAICLLSILTKSHPPAKLQ